MAMIDRPDWLPDDAGDDVARAQPPPSASSRSGGRVGTLEIAASSPSQDLVDLAGLGIGVVLHVPPGPLGEFLFSALIAVPRRLVVTQPIPKAQHPVDLGRAGAEHVQVDVGVR